MNMLNFLLIPVKNSSMSFSHSTEEFLQKVKDS